MADSEEIADRRFDAREIRPVPEHSQHRCSGVEGVARGSHRAPDVADDPRAVKVAKADGLARADADEVRVGAGPTRAGRPPPAPLSGTGKVGEGASQGHWNHLQAPV